MSIVDTGRADPFLATVKLLSDPAEMERRFAALRDSEERAQKIIALAGPAAEIIDIRRRIEEDLAAAKTAVVEARKRAEEIEAAAKANADRVVAEAAVVLSENQTECAKLKKDAEALMAEARNIKADVDSKRNEVLAAMREVENAKTQATHEAEMARATRVTFESRLKDFNGLLDQFQIAARSL